jgi:hypothetical protein
MAESVENLIVSLRRRGYTPEGIAFTLRLLASELGVKSGRRGELLDAAKVIFPGETD